MISSDEIYESIGRLVRVRRIKLRLTQDDLAQRIGLKRTSITNIEKGRQKIQVHTLYELAAALEVDPPALVPTFKTMEPDTLKARVKGMRPDEREFVTSVLTSKSE